MKIGRRKLRRILLLFLAVIVFFLLTVDWRHLLNSRKNAHLSKKFVNRISDYGTRSRGEKFVLGSLHGVASGAGIGNVVFEVLCFVGLAHTLGRKPILNASDTAVFERLVEVDEFLPGLLRGIRWLSLEENITFVSRGLNSMVDCCRYPDLSLLDLFNETFMSLQFRYTQSYKYFLNLTAPSVEERLRFRVSDYLRAQDEVIDANLLSNDKKRLCVHVRRRDFRTSPYHCSSEKPFTLASLSFVLSSSPPSLLTVTHVLVRNETSQETVVVFFGDDERFMKSVIAEMEVKTKEQMSVAVHRAPWSPVVPWAFSRLYCDVVLLTASSSTFGWWLAFLSSGQRVYFNADYSRAGGVEVEMEERDFFPPHWTRLTLLHSGAIVAG